MEEILGQKMRTPISLHQFLADYTQALKNFPIPDKGLNIQKAMKLVGDSNRFQTANHNCSLEHLQQDDDARITKYIPGFTELHRKNVTQIPHEALKLNTFNKLLTAKESTSKNPFHRSQHIYKMTQQAAKNEDSSFLRPYSDLIVNVRIYRPARATHVGKSLEKPVFAEEFECLGSNLLTELRDKISCICNKKRFFDISENPDVELPEKITDPGYFFITDTFYNDNRNPNNADYSEVIREWSKTAIGLKDLNFKVANMEETRFIDLTISMGFPQLYQHHGNCEHVFTFSQVTIITPDMECVREQYPRLRSFNVYNNRMCNMCGNRHYVFIVEQSDRQLHDPAYLCSNCFYSFHYIDGKKVGNFKAYRVNDIVEQANIAESTDEVLSLDISQSKQSNEDDETQLNLDFSSLDEENEFISLKMEECDT